MWHWWSAGWWIAGRAVHAVWHGLDGLGTWALSIVATLCVPMIPILIEFLKTGKVERDAYLITTAILAATFYFMAEHNLYKAVYFLTFVLAIVLDTLTLNTAVAITVDAYVGVLLLAVAIAHGSERFWWHVVDNRPFPDR